MARDFIQVDTSAVHNRVHGNMLLQYVGELRRALETGERVLAIMNHNNDGSVWTDIEELFGIPTGKGQTVYDMLNGSIGAMKGTMQNAQAKNVTETVGG